MGLASILACAAPGGAASISGRVTDADGRPLAGICVNDRAARTDADGRYRLSGKRAGSHVVELADCSDVPVYAPGRITAVIEPGRPATGADAVLAVGARVRGVVVRDGELGTAADAVLRRRGAPPTPVFRSAEVFFARNDGAVAMLHASSWAYWPADPGPAWFDGLVPEGTYKVFAREQGPARWFGDVAARADAPEIVLTAGGDHPALVLRSRIGQGVGGGIAGVVRDAGGQPVADVLVSVRHADLGIELASQTTGPEGSYLVGHLIDGDYLVHFTPRDALAEFYEDAVDVAAAKPVAVAPDSLTSGIDAVVERVPWCHGRRPTHVGTRGDDVIFGTIFNDVIVALEGNDRVYAGEGRDVVCGGAGDDSLDGEQGRDLLDGGAGDDRLMGRQGDDDIRGGGGHDVLAGGPGSDSLRDGFGRNVLNGGPGDDACVAGPAGERRGCESP